LLWGHVEQLGYKALIFDYEIGSGRNLFSGIIPAVRYTEENNEEAELE
jgi:hypothetical protein